MWLALVVPFLIGAPQMIVHEMLQNRYYGADELVLPFFFGIAGYGAMATVLWGWSTNAFEEAVGRTRQRTGRHDPVR